MNLILRFKRNFELPKLLIIALIQMHHRDVLCDFILKPGINERNVK